MFAGFFFNESCFYDFFNGTFMHNNLKNLSVKKSFVILFMFCFSIVFAQETEKNKALAQQYYNTGNYEKAAILYEELFETEKNNLTYYSYLYNALLKLNEYEKLEKIVKKQLKKYNNQGQYLVDLAYVYAQKNEPEKAKKGYEEAIEQLTADEQQIRTLAYKFIQFRLNEYLVKTYEKGNKLFKQDSYFAYDLGEAYLTSNEVEKAAEVWVDYIAKNPLVYTKMQSVFARNIAKDGFADALKIALFAKIQENSNQTLFPEILIWLFTHQKEYDNALIQAKALDKKAKEDGFRILQIAQIAQNEKDYDVAIKGFQYLIEKGEGNRYYTLAKSMILKTRKHKILEENNFTNEELLLLKSEFTAYIETYGKTALNASAIRDLAHLEAHYLGQLDEGVELLNFLLNETILDKKTKNEVKLDLGDIYILTGDVWEAILLYEQVNKDEKDSPLGEEARFRSARLSYYNGDFEWAQAQLMVLKGATSELIANDALDLSVFIIENLGLDTTSEPMMIFADAELLMKQNKLDLALAAFESIYKTYPGHELSDDILYKLADIFFMKRDYAKVESNLLQIVSLYPTGTLADNALFKLAELYEKKLNMIDKAKSSYEKILIEYSDSVLATEARKRFRQLRGDKI